MRVQKYLSLLWDISAVPLAISLIFSLNACTNQ